MKYLISEKSYIRIVYDKIISFFEFVGDYCFYSKNGMLVNKSKESYDYLLMLRAHSIEKGLANEEKRKFGYQKVEKILRLIREAQQYGPSFGIEYAYSVIDKYVDLYYENKWSDDLNFKKVELEFLTLKNDEIHKIDCGSFIKKYNKLEEIKKKSFEDFVMERHSIRKYLNKSLNIEDINNSISLAKQIPSACNRQMCKVYYISKNSSKHRLICNLKLGLSGFNKENTNFFIITYDARAFSYYAERNQGYLNAGLFSMNFVYSLLNNHIGSCFLQWNEKNKDENKIKKYLSIPKSEKICVILGAGYLPNSVLVTKSVKRKNDEILKVVC